jgi:hypothetical protein
MADRDTGSSRPRRRRERTIVLDAQWPHFKRTLSRHPGGLGAGIPWKGAGSRKQGTGRGIHRG